MPSLADHYNALMARDRLQAVRELSDLVAKAPQLREARALLATAHFTCLDFERSAQAAEELLAMDRDNGAALQLLGASRLLLGDSARAAAAFQRAAALGFADGSYGLGVAKHRLGDLRGAVAVFARLRDRAPASHPVRAAALHGLVSAFRDLGDLPAADEAAAALHVEAAARPIGAPSYLVMRWTAAAYPEWAPLAGKAHLARVLARAQAADAARGAAAGRAPATFVLPEDAHAFRAFADGRAAGEPYFAKPVHGTGGRGILVTADVGQLASMSDVVVQPYVRPFLIDERKCHLRAYVLVTSADPLRAYLYRDGVVRLALSPFELSVDGLGDPSVHITNTALHVGKPGFLVSDDPNGADVGLVRSLAALRGHVEAAGFDPEAMWSGVRDLVAWFLNALSQEGMFARQAAAAPPHAFPPKLFGLDILLDQDAQPWLIEVQTAPASRGSAFVERLHSQLCANIVRMTVAPVDVGVGPDRLADVEQRAELANLGRFEPVFAQPM